MKEKKERSQVDGTGKEKVGKKIPYEKPMVTAISLFADQVLNSCGKYVNDVVSPCYGAVKDS